RRRTRKLLREDCKARGPALAVVLLERLVNADLRRHVRHDFLAGDEEELVEDAKVRRVSQRDAGESLADLDRNRRTANRELRRQRGRDRRGQCRQRFPGNVEASVLLGQGVSDVVLGGRAPLDQERSDSAAGKALDPESTVDALLGDGAGAHEKDAQSRHGYLIIAYPGSRGCARRPGTSFPSSGFGLSSGASAYRRRSDPTGRGGAGRPFRTR